MLPSAGATSPQPTASPASPPLHTSSKSPAPIQVGPALYMIGTSFGMSPRNSMTRQRSPAAGCFVGRAQFVKGAEREKGESGGKRATVARREREGEGPKIGGRENGGKGAAAAGREREGEGRRSGVGKMAERERQLQGGREREKEKNGGKGVATATAAAGRERGRREKVEEKETEREGSDDFPAPSPA